MAVHTFGIVSGYGGTPANVETIAVSGATPLASLPISWQVNESGFLTTSHYFISQAGGNYEKIYTRNARGGLTLVSRGIVTWLQAAMSSDAYKYLVDTYIENSTNKNLVTIKTDLYGTGTYTDHNALFELTPASELEKIYCLNNETVFVNVTWTFRLTS